MLKIKLFKQITKGDNQKVLIKQITKGDEMNVTGSKNCILIEW